MRVPCVVPFCKRTGPQKWNDHEYTEIICGDHWRMISMETRKNKLSAYRKYFATCRDLEVIEAKNDGLTTEQIELYNSVRAEAETSWLKCKAQAIERAGGIS